MINLKRTAEMARENLKESHDILDTIMGNVPSKEAVDMEPVNYGYVGELNDDLEIILGASSSLLARLRELRKMVSIQEVCETLTKSKS